MQNILGDFRSVSRFSTFLKEEKNVHMEHIEDQVLNGGVTGARQAINFLQALRDMLAGNSTARVNATVKWDGAPAVFAGIDPSDGKFFVAKKGIFNKNPKVYKTPAEVDADTSGDLATKLKLALKYLPELGIKGVIQGDFLFSASDLKRAEIDGEEHITFHPNTIVYAVPTKSKLAKKILSSEIGIVWHTVYNGDSFENMKASFGQDIKSKLKDSKNVWFDDATYRDVSGYATMTAAETKHVTEILSRAGKLFQTIKAPVLNAISSDEELLMLVKTYNNSKVRAGQEVGDPVGHVRGMVDWINARFDKEADSKKTEAGKSSVNAKRKRVMTYFANHSIQEIAKIFSLMNLIVEAKKVIIRKMNNASSLRTLLKTASGFVVTGQEGYVAIDHMGKNAVKLVDRMEFSKANFSPEFVKGWSKPS